MKAPSASLRSKCGTAGRHARAGFAGFMSASLAFISLGVCSEPNQPGDLHDSLGHALFWEVGGASLLQPNIQYELSLGAIAVGLGVGVLGLLNVPSTTLVGRAALELLGTGGHGLVWVLAGSRTTVPYDDGAMHVVVTGPAYEFRSMFFFRFELLAMWCDNGPILYKIPWLPDTSILPALSLGTSW